LEASPRVSSKPVGVALISLIDVLWFRPTPDFAAIAGMLLIIGSVAGISLV
jgi:multidrug transporter EmrE-like cation transporter